MTSVGTVISFPVPPYANVPIAPQFFQPNRFVISAISFGITTTVTTTVNMNYEVGQLIRLLIPSRYGSWQLNEQTGYVVSLPALNQVEVSINSSQNVDTFIPSPVIPINTAYSQPQIIAVGDVNNGIISFTGATNIPGAFINISPV